MRTTAIDPSRRRVPWRHLPDAIHVELGALEAAVHRLSTGPTVVMCGHGERAAGAVSLLEHIGHHDLALLADLCRSL